ncbi:hypothetical protein SUGI_0025990 [Cryptomeria japonica]|nr:hypothetical protein SUGI_0025990 [Cryptomeria japonica]
MHIEDSKKFLCWKALGCPDNFFDKSLDIDGLVKICGGIPLVLEMVDSQLRKYGNDVRTCESTIQFLKDTLLKAIEEEALVKISEQGRVIVHDIFQARGRKLSEENRIRDHQSLQSALQDTQRLKKLKGIRLPWKSDSEPEFQLQAEHLDDMGRCLRVLSFGTGTRVTGASTRKIENLRYLNVHEDCSPMELYKLPRLAIFNGRIRSDDRLRVTKLQAVGLDESFGKLTRLEELYLSQNGDYMTRLPQSFGQLKSLRCLELYSFRELASLPDTFG